MKIGVLALQGAFAEHIGMIERLEADSFEIRQKKHLEKEMDGLIIPGGESTVIGKLLYDLDMFSAIESKIHSGLPVFGTCAGLILLAKEIVNDDRRYFSCMDIRVRRNAYGRQLGSFNTAAPFSGIGDIPMTFIRAPYIESVYGNAEELARVDGVVVAARQGNVLATAFHPELTDDLSVHEYFLNIIKNNGK